jgi:predicted unusual protein kinase regulating ubiquinone biosynthesis (AarF/ABC1/UbiB family)
MCLQDLLLAANDQPFRFPATFTFVVRSFTVLDGIGKSLDPRFDISEIAAPYARNLLLEGQPQVCAPVGCVALAQHVCSLLGLL